MAQKITTLLRKSLLLGLFLSFLLFSKISFAGSISIIIDDMGYDNYCMQKFLEIKLPIAFSFIPDTPFAYLQEEFCKKGYTVMLHMPSESINKNLNDYALLLKATDSKEEIFNKLSKALKSINCASGFNNHMGSKFLQSPNQVGYCIEFLKQHNLFFVDSLTTPKSVGAKMACSYKVPYAVRDMFIDNKKHYFYVKQNLLTAIRLAKHGKNVIVIGHDNIVDYEAIMHLKEKLKPYLKDIKENLIQCQ